MSFTNTLETRVLEWALTTGSPTRPTVWYVGLFTAAPGETGGGTEIFGGSYTRKDITFTVSGNTATNSAAVEFPVATTDWGNVTHIAIFDADTAGNMLAYAALTVAKNITAGDVLRVPTNDLNITLD